MAELAPPGFKFDPQAYVRSASKALVTLGNEQIDRLPPPLATAARGIVAGIESTAGASIVAIATGGAHVDLSTASKVINFTGAIVQNAVGVLTTTLKAAVVATEAIETIPMVGQMIGVVLGWTAFWMQKWEHDQEVRAKCDEEAHRRVNEACVSIVQSGANALPTSSSGILPADVMRQSVYAMSRKAQLPLDLGAMYIAMCGDEANPGDIPSVFAGAWQGQHPTDAYNRAMATSRSVGDFVKDPKTVGIPQDVRRRLWKLLVGVMAAVEPADIAFTLKPTMSDGGRLLMPLVQQLLLQEFQAGHWNTAFARGVAYHLGASYYPKNVLKPQAVSEGTCTWPTSDPYISGYECSAAASGLGDALVESLRKWQLLLRDNFMNPDGSWKQPSVPAWMQPQMVAPAVASVVPAGVYVAPRKKPAGVLTLTDAQAMQISGTIMPPWQKGVLAAAGLGAGVLSYLGVRKLAHGARR